MSQIKICPKCGGEGSYYVDEGHHTSDYVWYDCEVCNGTGRIIEYEYKFTKTIPYGEDTKTTSYKFDSDIHKSFRDICKEWDKHINKNKDVKNKNKV